MIKLTNILNESEGVVNLDTTLNRNILYTLLTYHPELPEKLRDYYRNSETWEFKNNYVWRTIYNFMRDRLDVHNVEKINEIALLFMINPDMHNPKEDSLFDGSGLYITVIEYAEPDYSISTEERRRECYDCEGWGRVDCPECDGEGTEECGDCDGVGSETCRVCDGSGEIEDEYGEEGDTLVCDDCDGDGETNCLYCDGDGTENCRHCSGEGKVECYECDGTGDVYEEYEEWELGYHKKYFISFEPLEHDVIEVDDVKIIDSFYSHNDGKKMFLWRDEADGETSEDGHDDISYYPNDLIDSNEYKLTQWEIKNML